MFRLTLSSLALFAQTAFAAAKMGQDCEKFFGIPSQYAAMFTQYTDFSYVIPLNMPRVVLDKRSGFTFETHASRHNIRNSTVDVGLKIDGAYDDGVLEINDINFSPVFPRELAWRIFIANVLDKLEGLQTVSFPLYYDSDEALVRGLLIQGMTIEAAITQTAAYKAFQAFGFDLEKVKISKLKTSHSTFRNEFDVQLKFRRHFEDRATDRD